MSYYLEKLEGPQRRAECERHDAADRAMDARLLHRVPQPAPDEGRWSESCRRATCAALGINPDAPLAFLASPQAIFWSIVVAGLLAAGVISWWAPGLAA